MIQRDAITDTPLLTASVDDSSRAPGGTSAHRAATRLAWALWALTLLLVTGYILLRLYWYALATAPGSALPPAAVAPSLNTLPRLISDLLGVGVIPAFTTLGALIVARARERRIGWVGWIYFAIGLAAATDGFCGTYAIVALLVAPGSLPAGLAFAWIQSWTWIVVLCLLFVFLPLLYPTGRLLSRRWRPVAVWATGLLGGGIVLRAVAPEQLGNNLLNFPVSVANPLGIAALDPAAAVIAPIAMLLLLLLSLLAATSLLLRLRRARGEERDNLAENSEYQAAKTEQEINEGRITELENKLARAEVIDVSKLSGSTIKFGATVTLLEEDTGEKKVWQIVGEPEADAHKGRISVTSPIARALIGKTKDDTIEVDTPAGPKIYKVQRVAWLAAG